jgi:hypothetical protein
MLRELFTSLALAVAVGAVGCTTYNVSPGWGGGWHGGGWGHTNVFVANTHSYYHPGRW